MSRLIGRDVGRKVVLVAALFGMACIFPGSTGPRSTGWAAEKASSGKEAKAGKETKANKETKTAAATKTAAVDTKAAPTEPERFSTDKDVIDYINRMIRAGWRDHNLQPSKPASDGEWCRRLYLDVLGRIPKHEEVTAFLNDKSPDKKAKLVERLTGSDAYVEDFAKNWTTIWTNILIGRTGGTAQNTLISREGMQQFLRRSFLKNKPYDEMAYELVSASGANRPGEEGYNGAVNFVIDNLAEDATTATAKTARIFLGLQVQCTQCHNHPFNDWKQDQFWSLNAFFRQTRALRISEGNQMIAARLVDQDFAGEGSDPNSAEIYYELRNGLLKVAYPVFVDGTAINPSGYVKDMNRRSELARLIRTSPYLGKAFVNRMWGYFLGYGFNKPVDDMGPHNQASHPELLARLGQEFAGHGYDVRQLIRWITLSEPYSLSSRYGKNEKDDPSKGESPMFSHFYLRQMTAEQLYESLIVATAADKGRGSYEEQERTKSAWLQQFSVAFGTDEKDETTTFNGTIPQTLMMMNGDLIVKATNCEPGTFLHSVATGNMKDAQRIPYLYLAAFARKPTKIELDSANTLWQLRKGNAIEAMQDIWWVLLNSNEFILNH